MGRKRSRKLRGGSKWVAARGAAWFARTKIRLTTLVGGSWRARAFSRISSGVDGAMDLSSDGNKAAFRQFLIRGAS